MGIIYSRISLYHPSSNGLAERAVQTVKHGIVKLTGTMNQLLYRFLLSYRIAPQSSTGRSPSELLMGRRLYARLDHMHPDTTQQIRQKQGQSQEKIRQFNIGDKVFAKDYSRRNKWIPATVTGVRGPVSFTVTLENGSTIHRHIDQLDSQYHTPSQD